MEGYIHSIYTGGMVDGPGIRTVVFFAGCSLRCLYCHNPDTWFRKHGEKKSIEEILKEVLKYASYYKFSGGGITVSGGEPTDQPTFLRELLKACRVNGIHTVLDTSGCADEGAADDILPYVDLLLLDLKAYNPDSYRRLTQSKIERPFATLRVAQRLNVPTQINYVLVPDLTDDISEFTEMAAFLKQFKNIQKIEILPFHKHGELKWKDLNIPYKLADTRSPATEELERFKGILTAYGFNR
ncbi:MAG: pyruvate formate-lyase-activating protein [Defluviitaleaceae bacterium]|nr:pyruvate formate-lyase-activating protein [Defluviitaleaceae bacterium]